MNDTDRNILAALIKQISRLADAQEESNKIKREDIQIIRDEGLDDIIDEEQPH
jgi:hypothetical protein